MRCLQRENHQLDDRRSLRVFLESNRRLNQVDFFKEELGLLLDCERGGLACRFFENWFAALKRECLKPYRKITDMINRHSGVMVAYRKPVNNIVLGLVEGMNKKIHVM